MVFERTHNNDSDPFAAKLEMLIPMMSCFEGLVLRIWIVIRGEKGKNLCGVAIDK